MFRQVLDGKKSLKWHLKKKSSKISIGRFYIAIDPNLKERGLRADNVYRLINRIAKSDQPSSKMMSYGPDKAVSEIKAMQAEAKHCSQQVENLVSEYHELKSKFETSRKQLCSARKALRDISNEKLMLKKRYDTAERKTVRFQELQV